MTANLEDLLARVAGASAPNRQLDADLHIWLNGLAPGAAVLWTDVAPYTASVDAALALVERLLPGQEITMDLNNPQLDWQRACIRVAPLHTVCGEESTLPLAIIAALLTALIAQQKEPTP